MISADWQNESELSRRRSFCIGDDRNGSQQAEPLELRVLLDESVLRRVVGSPEIMSAQLTHLIEADRLPNVSVRVVPFSAGRHKGAIAGPFVLLEFPRHPTAKLTEPPVVYIQGFTGALYLEKADEVGEYRDAYAGIQRVALDENASRGLIQQIAEELAR